MLRIDGFGEALMVQSKSLLKAVARGAPVNCPGWWVMPVNWPSPDGRLRSASCRAIVGQQDATALGLIESFMTSTADALIRRAASADLDVDPGGAERARVRVLVRVHLTVGHHELIEQSVVRLRPPVGLHHDRVWADALQGCRRGWSRRCHGARRRHDRCGGCR